jgi:transposase
MQYISGISRKYLKISSLEDKIASDNPPESSGRFIETFVKDISLEALDFTVQTIKSAGSPSFDTKLFLKIYLYGYLNGHRSSIKILKKTVLYTTKKRGSLAS